MKKLLFGTRDKSGLLASFATYTLLISIGFIYVYPVLYMLATSFMNPSDLLDSSTKWIPSTLHIKNYADAIATMDYIPSLLKNIHIALWPTLCQLVVTSMAGYAFARYEFPLKKLWLAILIFIIVIPPQITMIPTYIIYSSLKLTGNIQAFIVPALLGQGFRSSIFILIFFNFHKQIPQALIDAAEIDGAGHIRSFFRIAVPLSLPAIVVAAIFSFVWYWNETYLVNLYLGFNNSRANGGLTTLLLELQRFQSSYESIYSGWELSPNRLNEALRMAGTMLAIAPVMALYAVLQKQFVESVDRSGITGE
ncbi:MAG: carbohydrate ABC transporter permease [Clostridiales bacterium]|jgi:multiple sugar transport system permease protein|nr:carbohydrate ABC transporter permease [Clostridiales bacterium]